MLHINRANKRQNLLVNLCLLLNTFLDKAGHTSGFDENLDALCKVHPVVDRLSDSVSHVGLKIGLSLHCQFKLVAKNSCITVKRTNILAPPGPGNVFVQLCLQG